MKDRISITLTLVSVLISCCLVSAGCRPLPGYITIDSGSAVMNPKFRMYLNRCSLYQERLNIGTIIVWKSIHASEKKKCWEFNSGQVSRPLGLRYPIEPEMVWYLQYTSPDAFTKRLLTSPVPSLTYGEVPPNYQEKVKALPLEPERFYIVQTREHKGRASEAITFIIRLDESGIPERLEYHLKDFLITYPDSYTNQRDDLQLY